MSWNPEWRGKCSLKSWSTATATCFPRSPQVSVGMFHNDCHFLYAFVHVSLVKQPPVWFRKQKDKVPSTLKRYLLCGLKNAVKNRCLPLFSNPDHGPPYDWISLMEAWTRLGLLWTSRLAFGIQKCRNASWVGYFKKMTSEYMRQKGKFMIKTEVGFLVNEVVLQI